MEVLPDWFFMLWAFCALYLFSYVQLRRTLDKTAISPRWRVISTNLRAMNILVIGVLEIGIAADILASRTGTRENHWETASIWESNPDGVMFAMLCVVLLGGLYYWKMREEPPGAPVLFEPPDCGGPAAAAYLLKERHSPDDLQATLYDLAARGVLRLHVDEAGWSVVLLDENQHRLRPFERDVLQGLGLFAPGSSFLLPRGLADRVALAIDQLGPLTSARANVQSGVRQTMTTFFQESALGLGAYVVAILGFISMTTFHAAGSAAIWPEDAWWPVAYVVFAVALPAALFHGGEQRRSAAGREMWTHVAGFARFLGTDSARQRFAFAEHVDLFPRYLPWAIAFGIADAWADGFWSRGLEPSANWITWTGAPEAAPRDADLLRQAATIRISVTTE